MAAQFGKGDYVRYACNGVCLIDDIRREARTGTREEKEFYILKPVANKGGTIFIPADSPVLLDRMQPLPTSTEIEAILASLQNQDTKWIDDRKERASFFQSVLKQCDLRELLMLVNRIYQRQNALAARGKKIASSDEAILRRAEGLIENELSFVLHMDEKQVGPYIRERLQISE